MKDPRKENVEISVRPYCFWPDKPELNNITASGFALRQHFLSGRRLLDYQEGLIGPHWSKGWIIENNIIYESKSVGISLGTAIGTGHAKLNGRHMKGGTQREQEVILRALHTGGWYKDHVGSHIVRGNVIHDCEQAGIVGHMGAAFSHIYQNCIYKIYWRFKHVGEMNLPNTTYSCNLYKDDAASAINNFRTQVLMQKSDIVIALFGEQYRQWNTAMDASTAIALNKPTIIIRPRSLIHPLKELSNKANVTVETIDQALEVLSYIYK